LFMRAAASKKSAINSCPVSTFLLCTSFFIQPHKQKLYGFKQLSLGQNTASYTCSYALFSHNDRYLHVPEYLLISPPERACVAQLYISPYSQTLRSYSMPKVEWSVMYNSSGL
jgi:hypothetical protein